MRTRALIAVAVLLIAEACASSRVPPSSVPPHTATSGLASWYGQEFAGRTTANGEIFDPMLLTAAHRTLPFGTIIDVKNVKTGQTTRVRINDRGPFIGDRIIDLSYAAAEKIGLIEPGVGMVELGIVKLGAGKREPLQPYVIKTAMAPPAKPEDTAPPVAFPLPDAVGTPVPAPVTPAEATVSSVEVQEERGGVPTRKQVAPDGKTIERVDAEGRRIAVVPPPPPRPRPATTSPTSRRFVLQLGAFQVEQNALEFRAKAAAVAQNVFVERHGELYRVRVGPFESRTSAIEIKEKLDAAGLASILVTTD